MLKKKEKVGPETSLSDFVSEQNIPILKRLVTDELLSSIFLKTGKNIKNLLQTSELFQKQFMSFCFKYFNRNRF